MSAILILVGLLTLNPDSNGTDVLYRATEQNSFFGFINSQGMFKIEPQFAFAQNFSEGMAAVGISKKAGILESKDDIDTYGYIDLNGNRVIDFSFKSVQRFAEVLRQLKRRDCTLHGVTLTNRATGLL